MIELVEKLWYDVDTTVNYMSEHNEKILHYWTTGWETFLILVLIILCYFIYKKITDEVMFGLLFIILLGSSFLLYDIVPDKIFKPLLTE